MKTRESLIKDSFSLFIIKWPFFTKRNANTGVKVKSKASLMDLLFLLLLANGKHIEDF